MVKEKTRFCAEAVDSSLRRSAWLTTSNLMNLCIPTAALRGLRNRSIRLKMIAVGFFSLGLFALICWRLQAKQLQQQPLAESTRFHSDFQVVENGSAFVYSAYIDDRPARDFTSKADSDGAVVRLFVYFLRTIDVQRKWKCLLWSEDQDKPTVTPICGVTDLNNFAKLKFMVAMVICSMPKKQSDFVVRGVSLVSSDSNQTNLVGVVDLRHSTSSLLSPSSVVPDKRIDSLPSSLLPTDKLLQKKAQSTSKPEDYFNTTHLVHKYVTFTVCTAPIHGNYYTTSDIVNFIEVSRIFGADKFIFYFDENIDPSIRFCLESYTERGIVEMYPFTPPVLDGLHYHGQILSVTDCVYRTMYRTKYLINQDIDEVIVPLKGNDWQTMLNDIRNRIGEKSAEQIASYSFQNQFFPLEAPDDPAFGKTFLVKRYNIKTLLKTLKEPYVFPHDQRSKVMARPERILIWHVHLILRENLIRRKDTIYHVSKDDALLHHYRSWPTKRNLTNDHRIHKHTSLITERVHFGMGICSKID